MILTCPQCATRYQADASKFPAAGRSVRCAKCGNTGVKGRAGVHELLTVSKGVIASYMHSSVTDGLGRIGVMVALESSGKADELTAKIKGFDTIISAIIVTKLMSQLPLSMSPMFPQSRIS